MPTGSLTIVGTGIRLSQLSTEARGAIETAEKLLFLVCDPVTYSWLTQVNAAARVLGREILVLKVGSESDIDAAFATMSQVRVGGFYGEGPFFYGRRNQIAALAAKFAIPAIYELREEAVAGGLMSYGTNVVDAYRLVGVYSGQILKGKKPDDLPAQQLTRFELVINLKTAKALGLTIPDRLLALANEVIE